MTVYNYPRFLTEYYDLAEFPGPRPGEQLPDVTLEDLDGNPVSIRELRGAPLVIETGSATCPMYVKSVSRMAELMEQFPQTQFVVVYVREAHPGERTPAHDTIEEKRALAATLRARYGEQRRILVDTIDGQFHRQVGLLPDVVYVCDTNGTVRWRADWMNPAALEQVLSGLADDALLARDHFEPAKPPPWVALPALWLGGWKAIWDFLVGLPGLIAMHRRANQPQR